MFEKWGKTLTAHPCKIFWGSILFFILLSMGMAMQEGYENEQLIWTPADNGSLNSSNKASRLFPSKGGFVSFIAEVKDPSVDGSSVITMAALKEIENFIEKMNNASAKINETEVGWTDICNKIKPTDPCFGIPSILSFWNPTQIKTDQELLSAVQDGVSFNRVIELSAVLGGTNPAKFD